VSAPLESRLVNLIGVLSTSIADDIHAATGNVAGLSGAGAAALVALAESSAGESIDRLRLMVGLTPSGAVRLVDRLAVDGLVARRPGKDARTVALSLTPRGRRTARRIQSQRARRVEQVLGHLSESERVQLERLAAKVVGTIADDRSTRRRQGEEPPGGAMCRLCDFAACGRPDGHCPAQRAAFGPGG
jgi:DNA-binding MarR family transcriptional regulator